jgi:hypothetical protein
MEVRQVSPAISWKHGSPPPRRSGDKVNPGLTGPPKVTDVVGISPI